DVGALVLPAHAIASPRRRAKAVAGAVRRDRRRRAHAAVVERGSVARLPRHCVAQTNVDVPARAVGHERPEEVDVDRLAYRGGLGRTPPIQLARRRQAAAEPFTRRFRLRPCRRGALEAVPGPPPGIGDRLIELRLACDPTLAGVAFLVRPARGRTIAAV